MSDARDDQDETDGTVDPDAPGAGVLDDEDEHTPEPNEPA